MKKPNKLTNKTIPTNTQYKSTYSSEELARQYYSIRWRKFREMCKTDQLRKDLYKVRLVYKNNPHITLTEYNDWIHSGMPACVSCLHNDKMSRIYRSDVADHIIPVMNGGQMYEETNIQWLCHSCHAAKTRRDQLGKVQFNGRE